MAAKGIVQYAVLALLIWPIHVTAQLPAAAADRIEARRIADDIMRASERGDVQGLLRHLTADARFQVDKAHWDRRTYEERMRTMFSAISDYRYVRTNESVNAGPAGDVLMSFRLEEHFTLNGKRRIGISQQTYYMRREDGQLKIYRVVAR